MNTEIRKFSIPLRALHWSMAVLLVGLLVSGIYAHRMALDHPWKFDFYAWHRAFGVLAFALVILRLIVRFRSRSPEMPTTLPWHERTSARAAQIFLYLAMLAIPVFGYVASSAVPEFPNVPPLHSIWFFGLDLPLFPIAKNYETTVFYISIHKYLGYAMIAIITVHAAGALKHRLFDRRENDVLSKMI
ncbi:cytochrome b [Roseibium sp. SCP14]|uniref:cytochrome b n=1 Tax=Roseibium sp. SCP14 TaxID=3141375 RepID=UPI00333A8D17